MHHSAPDISGIALNFGFVFESEIRCRGYRVCNWTVVDCRPE